MSDRYPGGLIRKTPPTIEPPVDGEGGSAPGIWTLEQASYYQGTGEWPKKTLPRVGYTWGEQPNGELGNSSLVTASSPVQIDSGSSDWSIIVIGGDMSAGIKMDGTLWTWGNNDNGQLGTNEPVLEERSSPVQVGALTNWSKVAVTGGNAPVYAIKTDGTLWGWGYNGYGNLCQPVDASANRSSPVQIGEYTNWDQVVTSGEYFVARKTDGTLWFAGRNNFGVSGQNINGVTQNRYSSPVQVGTLTNWSHISTGSYAVNAVKTDGTLWGWGRNSYGRLGLNDTFARSSPVQVGALTVWSYTASLEVEGFAAKTDGTLWGFGRNLYGQFGLSNVISFSSPVQLGFSGSWSSMSSPLGGFSKYAFHAIKSDGTLWGSGYNLFSNVGDNTVIRRSSPVQIGTDTNWYFCSDSEKQGTAITKG